MTRGLFHTETIAVTAVALACLSGCEPQPQMPGEKLNAVGRRWGKGGPSDVQP